MYFQYRALALAKEIAHPEACQDAWGADQEAGRAVICDGVTSAIFSGQWARILASAVLAEPPDPTEEESFAEWLASCRQRWESEIDTTGLAWFQTAKLPLGAFSTLVFFSLERIEDQQVEGYGGYRMRAFAIGDSLLLHVRGQELLGTFPLSESAQLQENPVVLGSKNLGRDSVMQFNHAESLISAGDLIILCTDAVAAWALKRYEAGIPLDWQRYWTMPEDEWVAEIASLREAGSIAVDDTTILLAQLVPFVEIEEQQDDDLTVEDEQAKDEEEDVYSFTFQDDPPKKPSPPEKIPDLPPAEPPALPPKVMPEALPKIEVSDAPPELPRVFPPDFKVPDLPVPKTPELPELPEQESSDILPPDLPDKDSSVDNPPPLP